LSALFDSQLPTVYEDGSSITECESLLSVCPSEPGGFVKSSYQSSEEGGSVEDLIHVKRKKSHRKGSHLLPTSSLPNLHPLHSDPFRPLVASTYKWELPSNIQFTHDSWIWQFSGKEANCCLSGRNEMYEILYQHWTILCLGHFSLLQYRLFACLISTIFVIYFYVCC